MCQREASAPLFPVLSREHCTVQVRVPQVPLACLCAPVLAVHACTLLTQIS